MKYLRALLVSIVVWGGASAPAAIAYVEFLVPSAFQWQSTIERESGFETWGFFMNPSISFRYHLPDVNIDPEKPLAAPLTIEFGNPDWAIFDDGFNSYYPRVANGRGSVTYDLDWTIKEWDLTVDIILADNWYGTLTSNAGQISHMGNAGLVMHYDGFQPRPYIDPYDISEFYVGLVDGFWIMDYGITVPEPQELPLLLAGLLGLLAWRRRRQH